jgi:hypothetical protein
MGEVVYRSHVSVTRHKGPLRTARIPAEEAPVTSLDLIDPGS